MSKSSDEEFEWANEVDQKFQEILGQANSSISAAANEIMERNHVSIQHTRDVIKQLQGFKERYEEIIDNLIFVHAVAAKQIADLYGDMVLAENGFKEIEADGEAEDDDEEDDDDA